MTPWALLALAVACGGSSPPPAEPAAAAAPSAGAGSGDQVPAGEGDRDPTGEGEREPSSSDTAVCAQRGDQFGPIKLTAAQATGRYGHGSARFDQVMTSKERAVEVCGPSGELDWLLATSCTDGSHPFADRSTAHAARRGSMGAGGRCGSIIDLYAVPCPEQTYEVFMDMYMCGPDESM